MLALPNVNHPRHLIPLAYKVGVNENYIGEEVLVRFRELMIQVLTGVQTDPCRTYH